MNENEYKVLVITTYGDSEDDPDLRQNNLDYPEIVQYVGDEEDVFVIRKHDRRFWKASDFFHEEVVDEFIIP